MRTGTRELVATCVHAPPVPVRSPTTTSDAADRSSSRPTTSAAQPVRTTTSTPMSPDCRVSRWSTIARRCSTDDRPTLPSGGQTTRSCSSACVRRARDRARARERKERASRSGSKTETMRRRGWQGFACRSLRVGVRVEIRESGMACLSSADADREVGRSQRVFDSGDGSSTVARDSPHVAADRTNMMSTASMMILRVSLRMAPGFRLQCVGRASVSERAPRTVDGRHSPRRLW